MVRAGRWVSVGSAAMSDTDGRGGTLDGRLRLGSGFRAAERSAVLRAMAPLERHLASWDGDDVDIEVTMNHRDGPEQHVTVEAWLPGLPALVAKSRAADVDHALIEVRKDLIRQLEDEKDRHKPRKPRRA
jgi:ribosome-associated translation inhibitor RaiA